MDLRVVRVRNLAEEVDHCRTGITGDENKNRQESESPDEKRHSEELVELGTGGLLGRQVVPTVAQKVESDAVGARIVGQGAEEQVAVADGDVFRSIDHHLQKSATEAGAE